MTFTDEQLSAFIDGEADPDLAAAVEAGLETDPELVARLESFATSATLLRAAIDRQLGSVPPRLSALTGGTVAALPAGHRRRPATFALSRGLMAASLVLAVVAGLGIDRLVTRTPRAGDATLTAEGPTAGRELSRVLSQSFSGEPVSLRRGRVTLALSFRARSGHFCRSFYLAEGAVGATGVACRGADDWRLAGWATGAPARPQSGYAAAAGPQDTVTDALIDRLGPVQTLDRAAESRAIKAGWTEQ